MKHFLILLFVFIVNLGLTAQLLKGKVVDFSSKKGIPYVNIGVVGKGIGTVSDANGDFIIYLHDSINNETLKLSCIGYKNLEINVLNFKNKNNSVIQLEENIISLNQIVVKPKIFKTKILGNENSARTILAGFHTNDLGSELGVIMHIKKKPTYIEKASFNVAYNDAGVVKFRVNIYNMKNGLVDSVILKEPIIVEIDKSTRVLTVDLKNYNLVVENDFLVSLEWIEGYGSDKISFCAGLMNGNCLYRKTSQDTWQKANPVGVGFNCTVTYEK